MGRRYYRRRSRNSAGALINDAVSAGNRLPWWGAAIMGAMLFIVFYVLLPAWLEHLFVTNASQSPYRLLIKQIFEHRIHWVEYLGIVLGLIGVFFAVKNYFFTQPLSKHGETGVGILSRILGRLLD
jgi:drug/metabolite transporter (DMT)-like permease